LQNEHFEEEKVIEEENAEKEKSLDFRKRKNVKRKKLKVLVFSQFISMLDRIEIALKIVLKEGDIIRIDGSTNFSSPAKDGLIIFFLNARVGGEGLNLTAATRVIIVDPSWNIRFVCS
ncbi:hypothetical protein BAE44_0001201, partial [Dichanthelium oligosanthes]